ncbi:MAG: zinc ribbon domain-containing protein [Planctomycetota bacterium]
MSKSCPRCSAANDRARRFCRDCGARLSTFCSDCGFENDLEDRYCGGCGQATHEPRESRSDGATPAKTDPVSGLSADIADILDEVRALGGVDDGGTVLGQGDIDELFSKPGNRSEDPRGKHH